MMETRGLPAAVIEARPDLLAHLAPVYSYYFLAGRDFYGRPLLSDQLALLARLGVGTRTDEDEVLLHWLAMTDEDSRLGKELEALKKDNNGDGKQRDKEGIEFGF